MAVQTGGNNSRKTASARAISDLGALMSAKTEGNNTDSQPDVVQVQAPVTPVPDSSYITTASQKVNLPAVETVVSQEVSSINQAQSQEQAPKEETMSATQNASAPATTTAAAAAPAPAAATAAPADTTATAATTHAPAAAESTNPPTPTWALLEGLEKPMQENLDSMDGLRSTLSGRAERFSNLVAVTKDTVQRVDALEAKVAALQKDGLSRTVTFKHPDWKDEAVSGLVMGASVGVGVLGIAYAFDAMFGSPAAVPGEPAIQ